MRADLFILYKSIKNSEFCGLQWKGMEYFVKFVY